MTLPVTLAVAALAFCSVSVVSIALLRRKRLKWCLGLVLVGSSLITTHFNIASNPYKLAWLCNITAVLAIILCFRFSQRVFDVFVYFAWTGDVFTLLGWDNPLCPPLADYPAAWAAFWLKHIAPLAFSLYLFGLGKRVTCTAVHLSVTLMVIYACAMYGYNHLFDQNILDLMTPTLELEKAFGPWPIYIFVNVFLAICWYTALHWCLKRLGLVEGQRLEAFAPVAT